MDGDSLPQWTSTIRNQAGQLDGCGSLHQPSFSKAGLEHQSAFPVDTSGARATEFSGFPPSLSRSGVSASALERPVKLEGWSSAKFESTWRDTFSVLIARGRAQVGVHSAKSDWSRRILDFAYMDYDDQAAHHE